MRIIEQNLTFSAALAELKDGECVSRAGWNGKNMYIYLVQIQDYSPCLCMHTAKGDNQLGWLASQADMLAEDWQLLDLSDID